jgi:hypothetical protein
MRDTDTFVRPVIDEIVLPRRRSAGLKVRENGPLERWGYTESVDLGGSRGRRRWRN